MEHTINEAQWQVLKKLLDAKGALSALQIVTDTGLDHPVVMGTLLYGQEQGWLTIVESSREELIPTEKAQSLLQQGLPERRILPLLQEKGRTAIREIAQLSQEKGIPFNEVIKWGSQRSWIQKDKGELEITPKGKGAVNHPDEDERALELAMKSGSVFLDELSEHAIDAERVKLLLSTRTEIAKIKSRKIRRVKLTESGETILKKNIKVTKERNLLTSDDITSGEWKNIRLRPYDVTLAAEQIFPAKIHPMQKIIQETRKAFLEMGFTEIVSPQVESAFWDFDALFQPQDHPARDMQDTFYLERPKSAQLPDEDIVERVKQTHENGWETGSTGWGYKWSHARARQVVLRTHTTATSIRAMAANPNPPQKVFCVGKVYRNEALSYKHLPEFFQVDGIIIDKDANLATLLGTLKEFYNKMGFKQVRFKPAFYPYTEPSADVIGYLESKDKWIELGGSGVFRPEVTLPFGCKVPVLAWGLGQERLAMIRFDINDIRELYWTDLDKIKEVSLCR